MVNTRDELARDILQDRWLNDSQGVYRGTLMAPSLSQGHAEHLADALTRAGYTKPRVVTTVEELDALPVGSVVLSGCTIPRIKAAEGYWLGDGIDVDSHHIIRYVGTATVLHAGGDL